MARRLPCLLRQPDNLIAVPAVADALPGLRPGFVLGDPRPWLPAAVARWARRDAELLPWTDAGAGDALLAPLPAEERDLGTLCALLDGLPAELPVMLYEREAPLWPNLLVHDPQPADADPEDGPSGLRAYRSMFRHRGRGAAEAFLLLPAARMAAMLRGRRAAARRSSDPLGSRRMLQTALDHHRSLAARRRFGGLEELGDPSRVLVLSPHYDDESIGFAGAILRAVARGAEVRVVWMTDGARGIPDASAQESSRVRTEEAATALGVLGAARHHHLAAPETRLRVRGPWTNALGGILREFAPDCVFLPWWGDNSRDHYEANRVLRAAWPRGLEATVAAGGIWTPVPASVTLRLNEDERRRKDEAVSCYRSQLRAVDYRRAERGLGRWLAGDAGGHAEAYWALPARDYFAAFRASGADRRLFVH